jgi:hypothetical protein
VGDSSFEHPKNVNAAIAIISMIVRLISPVFVKDFFTGES